MRRRKIGPGAARRGVQQQMPDRVAKPGARRSAQIIVCLDAIGAKSGARGEGVIIQCRAFEIAFDADDDRVAELIIEAEMPAGDEAAGAVGRVEIARQAGRSGDRREQGRVGRVAELLPRAAQLQAGIAARPGEISWRRGCLLPDRDRANRRDIAGKFVRDGAARRGAESEQRQERPTHHGCSPLNPRRHYRWRHCRNPRAFAQFRKVGNQPELAGPLTCGLLGARLGVWSGAGGGLPGFWLLSQKLGNQLELTGPS